MKKIIKYIYKLPTYISRLAFLKRNKNLKYRPKKILIDVKENHYHRYLLNLIHFFRLSDYDIYIKPNYLFLIHWSFETIVKQIRNIYIHQADNYYEIIFSDNKHSEFNGNKKVFLNPNYFYHLKNKTDGYFIPMPMVDTVYYNNYIDDIQILSKKKRRDNKAIFSGNMKDYYFNDNMFRTFGCYDRATINAYLKKEVSSYLTFINEFGDFKSLKNAIIIHDRNKFNLKPQDYLSVLSDFSFFIALPGVVMPNCHNVIEAMALGLIPILQYNNWFAPQLENKVNCLTFSRLDQLKEVLLYVKTASEDEINQMRENVLTYFNMYLSHSVVVNNLVYNEYNNVFINTEQHSVQLFKKYEG